MKSSIIVNLSLSLSLPTTHLSLLASLPEIVKTLFGASHRKCRHDRQSSIIVIVTVIVSFIFIANGSPVLACISSRD